MSSSGIAPWLVQSKWPTVQIRYVARLGTGHTPSRQHPEYWEDCTTPWFTLADVWQLRDGMTDKVTDTRERISAVGLANSAAVKHPAGTVILSRTASVGFSAIMGTDMATSQDFATWTCGPKLLPRYLLYALRATAPDLRRVAAGSTHKTIYMPDIEQLRIPLPPQDEQRRIADFLDTETARIDGLVDLRNRQLAVLDEAASARTYSAIRGSHIRGDRVDSGLDWLGDVPRNWRMAAVSHLFEVELGKMLNQERAQGRYLRPYLRCADVQWDEIITADLPMMDFPPSERRRYRLKKGDLLVCEGGSWPGRCAIWQGNIGDVYYQKALHRLRSLTGDLERWLYYCLFVAERMRVFAVQGNSTTITHLTREQLKAQRFPFPDLATQRLLVEELDRNAEADQVVRGEIRHQIALLAERRQALITAAVTGQIEVSKAHA